MINAIFSQFIEATPVTVMVRGIMERVFEPNALDELFETHAVKQYTRELLFKDVVSLMSLVVSGIHPSVSAAPHCIGKKFRSVAYCAIWQIEWDGIKCFSSISQIQCLKS